MSETALSFPSAEMDPQALAEATVQAMFPRDNASQALGMRILEVAPGRARMSMLVRSDMLNGHATAVSSSRWPTAALHLPATAVISTPWHRGAASNTWHRPCAMTS